MVSGQPLPAGLDARIGRLRGVTATAMADAGRVEVNGVFANVIGVNAPLPPALLAAPTANSAELWRRIAAGGIVVSGKLARQDELARLQRCCRSRVGPRSVSLGLTLSCLPRSRGGSAFPLAT